MTKVQICLEFPVLQNTENDWAPIFLLRQCSISENRNLEKRRKRFLAQQKELPEEISFWKH
jgi:hypothetical protein